MKLTLCYLVPGNDDEEDQVIDTGPILRFDTSTTAWLHSMVDTNPEIIFFFVTPSTDIWEEDPPEENEDYSRVYDSSNPNWTVHPQTNFMFLKGVQAHMNNVFHARGHVFLNDVYDVLQMPRSIRGTVVGWAKDNEAGDGYIDFGLYSDDPAMVSFRNHETTDCLLEFNVDGVVVDYLERVKEKQS